MVFTKKEFIRISTALGLLLSSLPLSAMEYSESNDENKRERTIVYTKHSNELLAQVDLCDSEALAKLSLNNNRVIENDIFRTLENFPNLTYLKLSNNSTIENISYLSRLTSLRFLDVDRDGPKILDILPSLKKLEFLSLNGAFLNCFIHEKEKVKTFFGETTTWPEIISHKLLRVPSLTSLDLRRNDLTLAYFSQFFENNGKKVTVLLNTDISLTDFFETEERREEAEAQRQAEAEKEFIRARENIKIRKEREEIRSQAELKEAREREAREEMTHYLELKKQRELIKEAEAAKTKENGQD